MSFRNPMYSLQAIEAYLETQPKVYGGAFLANIGNDFQPLIDLVTRNVHATGVTDGRKCVHGID